MQAENDTLEQSSFWRNRLLWSCLALYALGMTVYFWYEMAGAFDWMVL